jgi:sulfur-carrier protein
MVVVEFYGLARLRAGRTDLRCVATTVGEALAAADAACPDLHAHSDNALSPQYRISVGGKRFTEDLSEPLVEGDVLLVLGADAGG